MILCREEASEVLAAAHYPMCYHIIQKSLDSISSFADGLRVIGMPPLEVDLLRNRWNDACQIFHLESLYQPLEIAVAPVNLNEWEFWVVLQLGHYFVEAVAASDSSFVVPHGSTDFD